MKLKLLLIPTLCLSLAGCVTVGPDYKQPSTPKADVSGIADSAAQQGRRASISKQDLVSWWTVFNDPTLSKLIQEALKGNLDVREARAKVREARAQLTISRAGLFPSVDATGSYQQTRAITGYNANDEAIRAENTYYNAGFDASWEIDIFGGTRRGVEAAKADIESEQASLESVWVSMAGEVAQTYVSIRSYQQRIKVAEDNLKAQADTLDILQARYKAGLSDELDVQQARYNLESSRSTIPSLKSGLESYINALAVLVGKMPGTLQKRLAKTGDIPQAPFKVVLKIPADTLRQRPDIRMAERALAAQTARIGEATAELYPKFYLTGSIGLESMKSSKLFNAESNVWSILPSVTWPIFKAGSIRANIEVQNAKQEQLAAQYDKAVLVAVKEIRNSLTAFNQEQDRLAALTAAVDAAQKAADIAQDKYRQGLVNFNNVLDAQRSLFSYDDERISSLATITGDIISLYKALGGGWQHMRTETPQQPTPAAPKTAQVSGKLARQ
ncbi:MAG: efflux transporter outer membrane subunit [Desulfarculus sp.]|nr:efflux transporter outer membrane subunit [Pseudomonadota bacterium]MBU4597517.1 efflux transporter outer membrane subunit [Pseudomonadota bacterium]MBV1718012.1 efflux transporter outer membrane subunit [Desulfarculus sp.]MBV1739251.1 efflux transporter outer membrane subunit [Desulfarculus sp.]